jgi:hypothetical protein
LLTVQELRRDGRRNDANVVQLISLKTGGGASREVQPGARSGRDVLIVKAGRPEALVVVRLSLAVRDRQGRRC